MLPLHIQRPLGPVPVCLPSVCQGCWDWLPTVIHWSTIRLWLVEQSPPLSFHIFCWIQRPNWWNYSNSDMCVCINACVCVYVDPETRKGRGSPLFITLLDFSSRNLFSLKRETEREETSFKITWDTSFWPNPTQTLLGEKKPEEPSLLWSGTEKSWGLSPFPSPLLTPPQVNPRNTLRNKSEGSSTAFPSCQLPVTYPLHSWYCQPTAVGPGQVINMTKTRVPHL